MTSARRISRSAGPLAPEKRGIDSRAKISFSGFSCSPACPGCRSFDVGSIGQALPQMEKLRVSDTLRKRCTGIKILIYGYLCGETSYKPPTSVPDEFCLSPFLTIYPA